MISMGAVIFEVLGDKDWGEKLRKAGNEYIVHGSNRSIDSTSREQNKLMGKRALALAARAKIGKPTGFLSKTGADLAKGQYKSSTDELRRYQSLIPKSAVLKPNRIAEGKKEVRSATSAATEQLKGLLTSFLSKR